MVDREGFMVDGADVNMGGRIRRVEDMPVYQALYNLALDVEKESRGYPSDFRWLRGQKLRSSESACANMAEGFYAQYSTEYLQCLFRSRREARETQTHLNYGRDVGLLTTSLAGGLLDRYEDGLSQLSNLIGSIERKIACRGKGRPPANVKEEPESYAVDTEPPTISHQPFPP
jgi:four helix bundle protein